MLSKTFLRKTVLYFLLGALICTPRIQTSPIIEAADIRNLELIESATNEHGGLIAILDKTSTQVGSATLKNILLNPTTDIDILKKRQLFLMSLVFDNKKFTELNNLLQEFRVYEQSLADFWSSKKNSLTKKTLKKFYFKYSLLEPLNDSPLALDIGHLSEFAALFGSTIEHFILHAGIDTLYNTITGGPVLQVGSKCPTCHQTVAHLCGCGNHHKTSADASLITQYFFTTLNITHWTLHGLSLIEMINHLAAKNELINCLHAEVVQFAGAIRALYKIADCIKFSPSDKFFNELHKEKLLNLFAMVDGKAQHPVIQTLLKDAFNPENNPSLGLFSSVGETLVTCAQLQQKRAVIESALDVVGMLDAFMAVARWIKETDTSYWNQQNAENNQPICFVNYIEAETPCIELLSAWNPMLTGKNPTTTNLSIGTSAPLGPDAMALLSGSTTPQKSTNAWVITGPNKSGKSIFLKDFALNTLLAQTVGICTALSARITPMHRIMTYIYINDDINNDQSTMGAELALADSYIKELDALPKNEFVLVLIDDSLFKSTVFSKGQESAVSFVERLGSYTNALVVVVSHYELVAQIGQNPASPFNNYQTKIRLNQNGKKESTYTLMPGICPQENIFDLLEDQGYRTIFTK